MWNLFMKWFRVANTNVNQPCIPIDKCDRCYSCLNNGDVCERHLREEGCCEFDAY